MLPIMKIADQPGDEELMQPLSVLTPLCWRTSLVPIIHSGRLTTVCSPNSRKILTFSGLWGYKHSQVHTLERLLQRFSNIFILIMPLLQMFTEGKYSKHTQDQITKVSEGNSYYRFCAVIAQVSKNEITFPASLWTWSTIHKSWCCVTLIRKLQVVDTN